MKNQEKTRLWVLVFGLKFFSKLVTFKFSMQKCHDISNWAWGLAVWVVSVKRLALKKLDSIHIWPLKSSFRSYDYSGMALISIASYKCGSSKKPFVYNSTKHVPKIRTFSPRHTWRSAVPNRIYKKVVSKSYPDWNVSSLRERILSLY